MRTARMLRGAFAATLLTGAALGAMAFTAQPNQATSTATPQIRKDAPSQREVPLTLRDGPRGEAYDRDAWTYDGDTQRMGPAPFDTMRDGGPPPWDDTRWGVMR